MRANIPSFEEQKADWLSVTSRDEIKLRRNWLNRRIIVPMSRVGAGIYTSGIVRDIRLIPYFDGFHFRQKIQVVADIKTGVETVYLKRLVAAR